ncbi:uncharacterized protein LOC128199499 [Bicyclus anynana]|uniref:Uncharacterized protein LOC128199499 n=1 Tax=Bicyclus anynana TaxID=110368 RepID=A0ABM3M1P1_BICAN|nr:uncharacterized protein LOC128199499 [Bicyclus anynana]
MVVQCLVVLFVCAMFNAIDRTTSTTKNPPPTTVTAQQPLGLNDSLSCDFNNNFCGWKNDPQATDEWHRDESGVLYAYLVVENTALRLLSPIYDRILAETGCFSSSFIIQTGLGYTIRIYQKPVNVALTELLQNNNIGKKEYILFEAKATTGHYDAHINPVTALKKFDDDFQIIIEVTCNKFFVIPRIDKVAILQGSNCTAVDMTATTPSTDTFEAYYIHTVTTTTLPPTTTRRKKFY